MSRLAHIVTSSEPDIRNRSLESVAAACDAAQLLAECGALEDLRHRSGSLYERVRALLFLSAIHRYHLPGKDGVARTGRIPFAGQEHLLARRFEESIRCFLSEQSARGPNEAISSALSRAYRGLAFQTLAGQVRRSVRGVRGNQWMFRCGHPADYPLRLRPELLGAEDRLFPVLRETTPVRMDLTHSGWSDIFFLGMDYPEGARVINISIDLSVRAADGSGTPRPPVEAWFRVIDEPVVRLSSVDLGAQASITSLDEIFDFARDYLGLLKAALIASGLIPPALEGSGAGLAPILERLTGRAGHGIELVSQVNDIPKGSRLAVSTNLLASLIAVCMRATGQTRSLTGPLEEDDRRLVAARAILGEWLGGSGGGWQDSGGVWPGIKLIQGELAREGDPEHGISRGCLLPRHHLLGPEAVSAETRRKLEASLILVHGGMAQDVGPILEMVTEKYLLRSEAEWAARQEAVRLLDEMMELLRAGDIQGVGALTQRNFDGPIQTIIPWATNAFTRLLIQRVRDEFGADFWGFWMLGGMAGGGMGFLFAPGARGRALERMPGILRQAKCELQDGVPFAMEPVVYHFAINEDGTRATLLSGAAALMPPGYYMHAVPDLLRQEQRLLPPARLAELNAFSERCRRDASHAGLIPSLFDRLLPHGGTAADASRATLRELLDANGFDAVLHEQIRADLRAGRIGLGQNRLPANATIEDVQPGDVVSALDGLDDGLRRRGEQLIADGAAAVVTLAGGAGSRWTRGAGVVKALHPFCVFQGRHRTFVDVHLAKTRRRPAPHVFTASYLTHAPLERALQGSGAWVSPGRSVGLRLIPMTRDLRFAWEEMPEQQLDERQQKVRESLRATLLEWARRAGEGSDYTDNLPAQCLHPTGHWFEISNLLRNGTLHRLLSTHPRLRYLMVHNIDTLGAGLDPALLALHAESGAALTFEVIARQIDDRGGGLARVDGRLRLVEGLAMPQEEAEFRLTWYSSMTTWVDIDSLLAAFELSRMELADEGRVLAAVRAAAARMPTYITLKDVKKRWGKGQEDIFPVAQFEKLWGDMSALPRLDCRYVAVPRLRGQQLKDVAQLDGWLRDGSQAYVDSLCAWE